ncbi:hypothetical protein [Neobacillus kokaensis]|uniref:Uncharacterized protein n=1 Tax=Neobacillus kokaensis TaxID=2759023 RepID=A0ABQ3NCH2_9BACI|nr:hypothetical protein [Neobacillus kokaensis]GHI01634.1 hypothetical protein AM1BK_51760 [Neobacillus kokaensis]
MGKLADFCWQGLTLQHVSHKRIVVPYLLFTVMALLFELFLLVIFFGTGYWSYTFGVRPGLLFFVGGGVLGLMMVMTVSVLVVALKKVPIFKCLRDKPQ